MFIKEIRIYKGFRTINH